MAKQEAKTEKIEREYIIPLREKSRVVPRYKKTPKAVKTIKEFLIRHMKVYDKDLNKIKIDSYLNEYLWFRGIKNPPHKVKVKAIKEKGIVKVELVNYPDKLKFKKIREEKREEKAENGKKKVDKKIEKEEKTEDARKQVSGATKSGDSEDLVGEKKEKLAEEKEKKSAVVEAGKEMEKAAAKKSKHEAGGKIKQPKHQFRMALQK